MTVAKTLKHPQRIEDVTPLYPTVPRKPGPHAIHARITDMVGALDELRTQVNIQRLKFGDSANTERRLAEAIEWLDSAENFIADARTCVTVR